MNETQIEGLKNIVEFLILPFALYIVRKLDELSKKVNELSVVLIGVDGKNGIRSRVIRVERRIERLHIAKGIQLGEEDDDV